MLTSCLKTGQFYVYVQCRPSEEIVSEKQGDPFYVGKSRKRPGNQAERAYSFSRPYNDVYEKIVKKYGIEGITVEIYPCSDETEAFELEKDFIGLLQRFYHLANLTEGGEGTSGLSPEAAARRSASLKKVVRTPEWGAKIANALRGKPLSEEHCKKLSAAQTGRSRRGTPSPFKGVPRKKEIRDKISIGNRGKLKSEEHRKNISIAGKGRSLSEECRKKISTSNLGKLSPMRGRHYTKEQRQIMLEKRRATMAKKTRQLDDTSAIANVPADNLQKHEYRSTSVRKIDNGFVVSESSNKDGEYENREYFSATQPTLGEDKGENAMKKAVDYMKRNGTL